MGESPSKTKGLLALYWLAHPRFGAEPTRGHALLKLVAGAFVVAPAWCAVVVMHGDMAKPHTGYGNWWVLFFACIVVAADIGWSADRISAALFDLQRGGFATRY